MIKKTLQTMIDVLNNVKVTPAYGQQARKIVMTQMHVNRKVIEAVQRLSLEKD